jgi:MFS family permease
MQTLPLYVLDTYNWSSLGAGLVFLPMTIPSVLSIPIAHFVRHLLPRTIVVTGFFLMAAPTVLLRWTQGNTTHHETVLFLLLFIVGICLTTVQAIIMGDVPNAVRKIESLHGITEEKGSGQARGYALCNMAFAAGQTIGPMASGFIIRELGWGWLTLVLGILCLVAGLFSLFTMSVDPPEADKNKVNQNGC